MMPSHLRNSDLMLNDFRQLLKTVLFRTVSVYSCCAFFCDSLLLTERFEKSFYYYLLLLLLLLFDFSIVILMRLTANLQLNSHVAFACVKSYSYGCYLGPYFLPYDE